MAMTAPQANLNEKIRVSVFQLAGEFGNLRNLAKKSGISYNALWGQLNRGQGILANIIPDIVTATRDSRLLSLIADSCGFLIAPKPKFLRKKADLRKREVDLSIAVGLANKVIEEAINSGLITPFEKMKIKLALSKINEKALEIEAAIDSGHFLRKEK